VFSGTALALDKLSVSLYTVFDSELFAGPFEHNGEFLCCIEQELSLLAA
jgi:hypothetical protein